MNWKVVKHKDLSMAEGLRIAHLKDQHWPYGLESQILWMKNNIAMDDAHLMGEEQDESEVDLRAYITFTNLVVMIDDLQVSCIGVGCVCVDKTVQHTGTGKNLMQEAEKYINEQGQMGILLCRDPLVPFYEKCGWKLVQYKSAFVAGNNYDHNIMLLGKNCACSNIIIDKNF
mgnify:CR=1 FL=1